MSIGHSPDSERDPSPSFVAMALESYRLDWVRGRGRAQLTTDRSGLIGAQRYGRIDSGAASRRDECCEQRDGEEARNRYQETPEVGSRSNTISCCSRRIVAALIARPMRCAPISGREPS